jgi:hypothetical protein
MLKMMRLPAGERQSFGHAARELVVRRFDAAVVLSQWEELYQELLVTWM